MPQILQLAKTSFELIESIYKGRKGISFGVIVGQQDVGMKYNAITVFPLASVDGLFIVLIFMYIILIYICFPETKSLFTTTPQSISSSSQDIVESIPTGLQLLGCICYSSNATLLQSEQKSGNFSTFALNLLTCLQAIPAVKSELATNSPFFVLTDGTKTMFALSYYSCLL